MAISNIIVDPEAIIKTVLAEIKADSTQLIDFGFKIVENKVRENKVAISAFTSEIVINATVDIEHNSSNINCSTVASENNAEQIRFAKNLTEKLEALAQAVVDEESEQLSFNI